MSIISSVLNLSNQLLYKWYREHLSGFRESEASGEHYAHDLHLSAEETVRVPICEPDNIGKNMAIDEKQIGEDMHTILSNRDTGRIAIMIDSLRFSDIEKVLRKYGNECRAVEVLTRDLLPLYRKVGNELFFNASHTADKFHVIRLLLEACQDVRVRLRQDLLRERRKQYEAHKKQEKERKKRCESEGTVYVKQAFKFEETELSNGETPLEALARSRYLLFKYPYDWTEKQTLRAQAIFEKYPEIELVYYRSCEFRNWMKKENVGKNIFELKNELRQWMRKVEQDDIDEMLNFMSIVERNLLEILNYFRFGATNAIAENINSKIQRFITCNQGTRDREFFYFRCKKYFS
ncbi:MAG: transposase [Tannerella sp.]|jgi:transposase|nr:transposase [Tannerella sp.]